MLRGVLFQPSASLKPKLSGGTYFVRKKLEFRVSHPPDCLGKSDRLRENVHRLKELIFAYEQAVDLHNQHAPTHEVYRIHSELDLRRYMRVWHEAEIARMTEIAIYRASVASSNSLVLADKYDRLEDRLAEWDQRRSSYPKDSDADD